jgi:hypothetical protein
MITRWNAALGTLAAIVVLASAVGCGGSAASRKLSLKVEGTLTSVFPEDGRRWTYEAENEVIIALDQLDAARDALRDAERRLAHGEVVAQRAQEKKAGEPIAKARVDLAEAEVALGEAKVRAAELAVFCARASLELTKARLAVRFDLPVEEGFVEAFEKQYKDCAEDLASRTTTADERQNMASKARESWREARQTYVKQSGDHDSGFWVE